MAALALGAGAVALVAGAELRRRAARTGKPKAKPRDSKLRAQTLAQIEAAQMLLEGRGEVPEERTIHETRKAIKRARALTRLQREALGEKRFGRVNGALRDAGRRLAGARDAEVAVDALEATLERHPRGLQRSAGVARLRAQLLREREAARAHAGAGARAGALGQLTAARAELERWHPRRRDRATARAGLRAIYRSGRTRARRARRRRSSASLHEWRKRVKDLRYVAEALKLRGLARRAERLGETIGAEHDLWLLRAGVRHHRECFKGEQASRRELERLIERRRRKLRKRALALGRELYRRPPKRFVRAQLGS